MDADEPTHVVTAFCRHRGNVCLLRRSDAVGTYHGAWGGVSGFAEGDPDAQVRVEIHEETGLDPESDVSLVRSGRPVEVTDSDLGREWVVHPYLFDVMVDRPTVARAHPEITLSEEHTAAEWVPATAILEGDRETVPALWEVYERVAPTVRTIAADAEHGASYLSIRALEVLRDRAGLLIADRGGEPEADEPTADDGAGRAAADPAGEWDELAALARRLLEARPSMAVCRNRVNRAMAEAGEAVEGVETATVDRATEATNEPDADGDGPAAPPADAVLEATIAGIERAVSADRAAADAASEFATGRVLTLSRSGTVREALRAGAPDRVFVAESRPAREGVAVAEELAAESEFPITVHTDAATAHVLATESIDALLVGADTVLPDGRVVNKTGTRAGAIAAAREGVPVYAVAASDTVSTREAVNLESGDRSAIYDGTATIDVANPTFDVTTPDAVTGIVTERGVVEPDEVSAIAAELRALETWRD